MQQELYSFTHIKHVETSKGIFDNSLLVMISTDNSSIILLAY